MAQYRTYICVSEHAIPEDERAKPVELTGTCADHNEEALGRPSGYTSFFDWCADLDKTHKQRACAECGLFKVWVSRPPKRAKVVDV